jgi:hypothetical protein
MIASPPSPPSAASNSRSSGGSDAASSWFLTSYLLEETTFLDCFADDGIDIDKWRDYSSSSSAAADDAFLLRGGVPSKRRSSGEDRGQEKWNRSWSSGTQGYEEDDWGDFPSDVVADNTVNPKRLRRGMKCGYDPSRWLNSTWYRMYVLSDACKDRTTRAGRQFRRRFRMPWETYRSLVKEMRDDKWFAEYGYENKTALGHPGVPLDLYLLGALRYLGRGWTFDDVCEATGVSEESHRLFLQR